MLAGDESNVKTKALAFRWLVFVCLFSLYCFATIGASAQQPSSGFEDKQEKLPLRGLGSDTQEATTPTQAPISKPESTPSYSVQPGVPAPVPDINNLSPQKPPDKKDDLPLSTPLDEIRFRSIESSGTIFVDPEKISVKAPVLSALITLNSKMSPYQLDAGGAREVGLKDALLTALGNNLDIKIVDSETGVKRWNYYSNLTNFLPTVENVLTFQGLKGSIANPAGVTLPLTNPFLTMGSTFTQPVFTGGRLIYSALQAKHQYRASQFALKGSTNDTLLETTKLYYQLLQDEVLMQIRIKALEVSDGLVELNQDLYEGGVVTKLDVLQARTQRSKDRQHLIAQQVDRRKAAVDLATALNLNTDIDLSAANRLVAKTRLVDESVDIGELLQVAVDNRPELKQFNELRIAAKDAIKIARAEFLPQVNFTGSVLGTGSKVVNGGSNSSSIFTSVLSGGAVAGSVSGGSVPLGGGGQEGSKRFVNRALFFLGVEVMLPLRGLGGTQVANLQAARWQARRVQNEFARVLTKVYQEVRNSYLDCMDAENQIRETTDQVNSSEEQLAVAEYRLRNGVGTNLDVINAQRDYTGALVDKAKAIIKFNMAEARLLHSTGKITVDTLTATIPMRK